MLSGSPITDIKITLIGGKAHQKHTEGGDFREATYRAVRQGLKAASSILLEPIFKFRLSIPHEYLSRAIYDIEQMQGKFTLTEESEFTVLTGTTPVSKMQNYQSELAAYSKGKGQLSCVLKGYEPCLDEAQVLEQIGYDSEKDLDNPTGSIFCSHGAGYFVPWNEVPSKAHVQSAYSRVRQKAVALVKEKVADETLEAIFIKTYGPGKQRLNNPTNRSQTKQGAALLESVRQRPLCYLIDGYNIIHAWPNLQTLAAENLDAARSALIRMMGDFQGYKQCLLILVFDAYKVSEGVGSMVKDQNIFVVYTEKAQTADMYIERATHKLSNEYRVVVATSDGLEQLIVSSQGAHRMSARELYLEFEGLREQGMKEFHERQKVSFAQPLAKLREYEEQDKHK